MGNNCGFMVEDGGGDGESEDFLQGVAKVGLVSGDLWDIWSVWRPDKPKDNDKDKTISNTESNDFLQVDPRVRWAVLIEHQPT